MGLVLERKEEGTEVRDLFSCEGVRLACKTVVASSACGGYEGGFVMRLLRHWWNHVLLIVDFRDG
jgi:hypothetical protein